MKEIIGIDNAVAMVDMAKKYEKEFPNFLAINGNLGDLSRLFAEKYFEFSLCIGNTLGNVENEKEVLKELAKVTEKSIFITVFKKGTMEERKEFYKTLGIEIKKIDKNETFYAENSLQSKAYSIEELETLAREANLTLKESKDLNSLILWAEFLVH